VASGQKPAVGQKMVDVSDATNRLVEKLQKALYEKRL
jgi:hypothetical protein